MGWFRRNEHDEERLSAYLDGELTTRQTENVERHLAGCDACAALLEELRETRTLLSALPAQTPRRSFVLGAEYARAPVRDAPAPRRLSLALAPVAALSVFVALVFVDLAATPGGSDEDASTFTAATSRQADDAGAAAGSVGAPEALENAASPADPVDTMSAQPADGGTGAEAAAGAAEAPPAGDAATVAAEGPAPRTGPPEPAVQQPAAEGEAAIAAEEQAPDEDAAPETLSGAPAGEDDDGISFLRVLQVIAAAAFLASGFYVFVRPRLSRGGSQS